MDNLNISLNLSDDDKALIGEAVREVIKEEIEAFGKAQRSNVTYKDTKETCQILNCSKPTLSRWRDKGYIEGTLIGGKYLYSEDQIKNAEALGLKYRH